MINLKHLLHFGLPTILLFACNQTTSPVTSFNEEAEKKGILQTIETETRSFFTNDSTTWKSCYIQTEEESTAWNNQDGTFDVFQGFKSVETYALKSMRENPMDTAKTPSLNLQYRDIKVKFLSPEFAFVQYKQFISDNEGKKYFQTFDQRIMQKESNKWKIRNVTSIWNYKNKLPIDSLK